MHVVIDGYGGDSALLSSEETVRVLLDRCPDEMGMTKITQPMVMRYQGVKPEDWGISGFVMIAESHISIHTFPDRGLLWVDAFSCKGFDAAPIVEELRASFRLREVQMQVLERGLEYSTSTIAGAATAGASPAAAGER